MKHYNTVQKDQHKRVVLMYWEDRLKLYTTNISDAEAEEMLVKALKRIQQRRIKQCQNIMEKQLV